MWNYPDIDPVLISIGPVSIHWYAVSYIVGIGIVWWLLRRRAKRKSLPFSDEQIADLAFYGMLGVILGGRIGYMLFYNLDGIIDQPTSIFRIWEGGMSFHGGMLGVIAGMFVYARLHKRHVFEITDFIAPAVPIALGCGRLGNFVNGELPGRVTDLPWGVIFPGEMVARHPSSLYQFLLEGPVLFAVLWIFSSRPRPLMAVSGLFLFAYGCLRLVSESFREPDGHIGFIAFDWLTLGQLLSIPMILIGIALLAYSYHAHKNLKTGKQKS